jgi:hypothetical protein
MSKLPPAPVHCPHCGTQYRVVRIEAATNEAAATRVPCLNRGDDLVARGRIRAQVFPDLAPTKSLTRGAVASKARHCPNLRNLIGGSGIGY